MKLTVRPPFKISDAELLIQRYYNLQCQVITEFPSYSDRNFYVKSSSAEYVLKISHKSEKYQVLDLQVKALQFLEDFKEMEIPRIVPSSSNDLIVKVSLNNATYFIRLLTFLPGVPFSKINPHSSELIYQVGLSLGHFTKKMQAFSHPPIPNRSLVWDMELSANIINRYKSAITDVSKIELIEYYLTLFQEQIVPQISKLRTSIIHNDANDNNLIINQQNSQTPSVRLGLIDFGDMILSCTIFELAICIAYAINKKMRPLDTAAQIVKAFHSIFPITDQERRILYILICIRLCTSVVMSAYKYSLEPDNEYLKINEQPAWTALYQLKEINSHIAYNTFRQACQLPPIFQS